MRKTEAQFDIEQIINTYREYDFEIISQSELHISFINSNGFTPYIETIYIDDKHLPNLTEELGAIEKKIKFQSIEKIKLDLFSFLITHDPQPASRADMASAGLPRLHAPIQQTSS